jgi:hyperosmotically inducible periplasmic protein
MKPHHFTRLPLLAAVAAALALSACGKQDENLTAGERMDGAVADAQMSASQAADTTARVSTDMGITAKVNAALVADDQLKATQINVDTRDGQVTLSGSAPDAQARERATTLAAAVDGVKQVNNQLVVSG